MKPDRPLPTFIVIGAMKAGTTSLYHYLRSHPQVYMPAQKEIEFFSDRVRWERGPEWYRAKFAEGRDVAARGEASPGYTKYPRYPSVPERMADLIPHAKLIYLLRDPIDRIRSQYIDNVIQGWERRPMEEAIFNTNIYIPLSMYALQIGRFLEHFPRGQIFTVFAEDLRARRRETLEGILRFIEVDPTVIPEGQEQEYHVAGARREPRRALALLFRSDRVQRIRRAAPEPAHRLARRLAGRPVSERIASAPLPATMRERLTAELHEDVAELRSLLGTLHPDWMV